jgi:hypothetical protein
VTRAAGKTERVEVSHGGDVGEHFTDHSESGWTTSETFCRYLRWLRDENYRNEGPLWLIFDSYSAHRTEDVRNVAAGYAIELLFIPPGMKSVCRSILR